MNTQGILFLDSVKKDRFCPHFCKSDFYVKHLTQFQMFSESIQNEIFILFPLDHQQKSKIECSLWTIYLSCLRRHNDWFGGFRKTNFIDDVILNSNGLTNLIQKIDLKKLLTSAGIEWPKKLNTTVSLYDFLNRVRIKPLPESALRSIFFMLIGHYPLTVLDHEPEPVELLQIQSQGRRIVTFENDHPEWSKKMYGHRDPLSFWLHDFVHADHFFFHSDHRLGQLGFYKLLLRAADAQLWLELPQSDAFTKAFHYLMSDMNTHPLHLLKTYRALIDIHDRQVAKPNTSEPKSMPLNTSDSDLWQKLLCREATDARLSKAWQNLNTPLFTDGDCDALLNYLQGLGAES